METNPKSRKCDFGQVHLWSIQLDCAASSVARLELALSSEERYRAARFRSHELRNRWTVARGALRHIRAEYSRSTASSLAFHLGPNGKPELARSAANINFNLSQTHGLALLAITRNRRVGIDAEAVQPEIEVEALSRRFFTRSETAEILGLANGSRIAAFFACWTRKESSSKLSRRWVICSA